MEEIKGQMTTATKALNQINHNKNAFMKAIEHTSALSEETSASAKTITKNIEEQVADISVLSQYTVDLNKMVEELNKSSSRFKL